jgi:hypothetical protein
MSILCHMPRLDGTEVSLGNACNRIDDDSDRETQRACWDTERHRRYVGLSPLATEAPIGGVDCPGRAFSFKSAIAARLR